ncbi:MAG: hypothetical protein ABI042_20040 [Verrucomicrobiota bacterium]
MKKLFYPILSAVALTGCISGTAAWSAALQRSLIVWEGEGAIFCSGEE